MLATWLNQERWKDATGTAVVTPVDIEASEKVQQAARDDFDTRI